LTPDDPIGKQAFSVIRDAMEGTKTVGVSRLVLYRRERAVLTKPREKGMMLWTLRTGDEVRDSEDIFGNIADHSVDPKLLGLVTTLIDERTKKWSPDMVRDPVQKRLLEIISSKKKGGKRPIKAKPTATEEQPSNVISIMDALRKSISSEKRSTKR
jgi:DNA end-binding protein Ku